MKRRVAYAIAVGSLLLAGCGGTDHAGQDDLHAFVAGVRARPGKTIEAVPQLIGYQAYAYRARGRRAPFTPDTTGSAPAARGGALAPDPSRQPDPLEHFPLDALAMVGTIKSAGVVYALVRAPDQVIYRAARGDHLGQHFGAVQSIDNGGLSLIELVPDGHGGYDKRSAMLTPSG